MTGPTTRDFVVLMLLCLAIVWCFAHALVLSLLGDAGDRAEALAYIGGLLILGITLAVFARRAIG